ncbi:glucodextranase DOMON-like domain-containing protein [Microbacterium sp. gxy059]|uniref:glucodextranase DOMON-like domain-containing protein n=1 Tax=Microbacterium sp. gxy059 TaxID=2957199 RepID=UPI003D98F14E
MNRTARRGGSLAVMFALACSLLAGGAGAAASEAPGSEAATTWDHENAVATTGAVADDEVRRSPFYEMSVRPDGGEPQSSFVYMSTPRSGKDKAGYDDEDGAEYAADAELTMSWSSFEYSEDVWVEVSLLADQPLGSADDVTIRPTDLALEKELVDEQTVRIRVPHTEEGLRFSVEFDPQLITAYNDMSGASGALTTDPDAGRAVHTEPQNAMLVFANPALEGDAATQLIPTEDDGSIHRPEPGLVDDLDEVSEEIIVFEPGAYYMGSDHHALLPENVRWVYLAPGAHVKGAFRFVHETQEDFRVTGRGVLSGEQYVYEADTANGYQRSVTDNCHTTCVKMLQFESSDQPQTLGIEGITISDPPYHSFVVYAHEDDVEIPVQDFRMDVSNYKQVGSWYWQTDGIELYPGGRMSDTFFHANDDVLKMYHSDVEIDGTVIWKNENGPVFQWGWTPREVDGVRVSDTDVIHNRMAWKDVKKNTCVFNSSTHWEDPDAVDRADPSMTVKNMTFRDTRVEGAVNCALRIFALSATENIEIDGFEIEEWNDLDPSSQVSLLTAHEDGNGERVRLGDEMSDGDGILLHDYSVSGVPIIKAGDQWADDEPGRLGFDAVAWESWNATATGQPTGALPLLTLDGIEDGGIVPSRDLTVRGTTDGESISVRVGGESVETRLAADGSFAADLRLPDIENRVVVTATGENGVKTVERLRLTALGTLVGSLDDPVGDDDGPGSYTYPSDGAFNPGSFDLTRFEVFEDGDVVRFVVSTDGEIRNPWGGDGMSTQRVSVHVGGGESSGPVSLLPGTNTFADGAWTHAVVADGRQQDGRFGAGVYDADHERVGDVDLEVSPAGRVVASVSAEVFAGVDLAEAGYQVSMFSAAEESEGVGGVRPVYSAECAAGVGCPEFVGAYRFGGGAGDWTDAVEAVDTDTADSNAIDIISGPYDQGVLMDWTRGPVVLPYLSLVPVEETEEEEAEEDGADGSGAEDVPPPAPDDSGDAEAAEQGGEAADDEGGDLAPTAGTPMLGFAVVLLMAAGAAILLAARRRA